MAAASATPRVVIAARGVLIEQMKAIGGSRMTDSGAAEISDWLISSGNLADSFYDQVATTLAASEAEPA